MGGMQAGDLLVALWQVHGGSCSRYHGSAAGVLLCGWGRRFATLQLQPLRCVCHCRGHPPQPRAGLLFLQTCMEIQCSAKYGSVRLYSYCFKPAMLD
jgi:hypothetical protein